MPGFRDFLNRPTIGGESAEGLSFGDRIRRILEQRATHGGLETARIAPGPAERAVFGGRVETLLGSLGLGGGQTGADLTEIGDVAAGRVGRAFGAADLRIRRPGSGTLPGDLPGGPARAPTADPNRTIPRIPRQPGMTPTTSTAPTADRIRPRFGLSAVRI